MSETFTRKQLQAAVAKRLEDFEFAGQVLLDRQREHITALEKENAELLADCKRKDELLTAAVDDYNDARSLAIEECARMADEKASEYEAEGRDVRNSKDDKRFFVSVAGRLRGLSAAIRARLASSERTEGQ